MDDSCPIRRPFLDKARYNKRVARMDVLIKKRIAKEPVNPDDYRDDPMCLSLAVMRDETFVRERFHDPKHGPRKYVPKDPDFSELKRFLSDPRQVEDEMIRRRINHHLAKDYSFIRDLADQMNEENYTPNVCFSPREIILATFPHKDPGDDVTFWVRKNGNFSLCVQSGFNGSQEKPFGLPYGSMPRLLMYWLTTEALRKKDRVIELGPSFAGFLKKLGLTPDSGLHNYKRLENQMTRLFRSKISFDYVTNVEESRQRNMWVGMNVTSEGVIHWSKLFPKNKTATDSWVKLDEGFYESVTSHAVPLDLNIVNALRKSPLALDFYAWVRYASFLAYKAGKERKVPWAALKDQFGTSYGTLRAFRFYAREALQKICLLDQGLKLEDGSRHLTILPVRPLKISEI